MNLTAFAVARWQITLVAFMLLVVLGISAFLAIPRSVDPHFPVPNAIVTAVLPGADAAEMEETIAKPIEDVLQGLDEIRTVSSTSTDGTAVIVAEFDHGSDAEQVFDRTVRDVSAIRGRLPEGLQRLDFRRPRTTEAAVMQIALVSEGASWRRMSKVSDDLRDRLNGVDGVRLVTIDGRPQSEVRIAIDPGRLAEARIPASAVADAVAKGGVDLPAGAVHAGGRRYNIDAGGAYRDLAAVAAVPVRAGDGRLVRVGDIATVGWATAEQLHIERYNGKRAVILAVKQKDDANAIRLRDMLNATIARFRGELPPDMALAVAFDQSRDIEARLGELARDFAIALALVLLTLVPLGFRSALIVMIAIPLSLAIGVLGLSLFGFTLNQISIAGFILSLGLLVDDSIVVTENIGRHLREGAAPEAAAIEGTREITAAVIGSTGVLLFAFLPLAFLPETSGDYVRALPASVIMTVLGSLLVSLTIIPFAAHMLLKPSDDPQGNRMLRVIDRGIHRVYAPLLRRALDHPRRYFYGAAALCLWALALIPLLGFSLFPSADTPYFLVRVEAPQGSSVETTDKAVRAVSAIVARVPGVKVRVDNAGRGHPQVFYNSLQREEQARFGEIFVSLDAWDVDRGPELLARLRKRLSDFPDARVMVVNFENGPAIEAPVAIRIRGPDLGELKRLAAEVAGVMRAVPGTRDVDDPLAVDRIDLDLGLDEAKAGLLGVAPGAARRALRLAISGEPASRLRDNEGDSYPVVVRLPMDARQPVSALGKVYVPSLSGGAVPLAEIARPTLKSVPPEIKRYRLQRSVTVTTYAERGRLASDINAEVERRLGAIARPAGYSFEAGGEAEVAARNASGLGPIVLLALFGIFGVLVAEFGRFRETLVVAGVIPLGLVGGMAALLLTGNSLSFLAIIGFVALIGIEIKNSILLVDFTSRLRARGLPLREAIEKAGEIRFLPVLLTSVTAIGGLLPLALSGASLYAPLAWVIIGGLVSSTLLSRVVTPLMYLLVARGGEEAEAPAH